MASWLPRTQVSGQRVSVSATTTPLLPGASALLIGRGYGRAAVNHQVAGIGGGNRDVKEAHRGGVTEPLVGDELKHGHPFGYAALTFQAVGLLIKGWGAHRLTRTMESVNRARPIGTVRFTTGSADSWASSATGGPAAGSLAQQCPPQQCQSR